MLTRVIIAAGCLLFCKCFTDEETLTKEVDEWLTKYNLNDGCTGFTPEEVPALNAMFAERYDDPMNLKNFVRVDEDFEDKLEEAITDRLTQYGYDYDAMVKYAEAIGVDIASV